MWLTIAAWLWIWFGCLGLGCPQAGLLRMSHCWAVSMAVSEEAASFLREFVTNINIRSLYSVGIAGVWLDVPSAA